MRIPLMTVSLRRENDLLLARQRSRQITQLLGFSTGDSTRVTTAVAEIARNALTYGKGGTISFMVDDEQHGLQSLAVQIADKGPGISNLPTILDGKYGSETGMGIGITGSRALMDRFHIESAPGGGTCVKMSKMLPRSAGRVGAPEVARLTNELAKQDEGTPFGELQSQNQELMRALEEVMQRQAEVEQLRIVAEQARHAAEEAQLVAERSLVVQERFMALTTHEFRTPLNAMMGYLELLEMGFNGSLDEKQTLYFERTQRACKHLVNVTNDFLDMAKGESGQLRVAQHSGAARHVIAEAAALVAPQATTRGVEITLVEETERITYLGDVDRIRQILINVLGNAVSFTPPGGSIHVVAACVEQSPEDVELTGGPWCTIRVADSGPGIPIEKLEHVFEPFVQVASGQSGRRGTGLGLTVSRQLARLMGGDLTVECCAGIDGGAAFTLWLPVGTASATPAGGNRLQPRL